MTPRLHATAMTSAFLANFTEVSNPLGLSIGFLGQPFSQDLSLHDLACVFQLKPPFQFGSAFSPLDPILPLISIQICIEIAEANLAEMTKAKVEEEARKSVAEEEDIGAQVAPTAKL